MRRCQARSPLRSACRPRLARAGLAALALLLAAGCAPSRAVPPPGAARGLADCTGHPQARPAVVVVMCQNGSMTARNLRWSGWGRPVATATGTAVIDICAFQDCAAGDYAAFPVVLVASGAQACRGGHAYARIQYLFVGRFDGWPAAYRTRIIPRPCG